MRKLLLCLLLLLIPTKLWANQAARGWCESGQQNVVTSGLTSTTQVQASYPSCTVTVYNYPSGTPATIYSDNNNTPLSYSFQSATNGQWQFYAANGRYTVTMTFSQPGAPPVVTYSDIVLFDQTAGINTSSINNLIILDGIKYTSVQAGINALGSSPGTVYVPPGTWQAGPANTGITMISSFQHLVCQNRATTVIQYTGTTLNAVVSVGTASNGTANLNDVSVTNCTIQGNANTTYGLYILGTHRSDFSGNSIQNVTTSGIYCSFCVVDNFSDTHVSINEYPSMSPVPANCIYFTGPDGSHEVTSPLLLNQKCEGVTGDGLYLNNTVDGIVSGTSEANARGANIPLGSARILFLTWDAESNSTEDLLINGSQTTILNSLMASTHSCHVGANATGVFIKNSYMGAGGTCTSIDVANQLFLEQGAGTGLNGANSGNVLYDAGIQNITNKTFTDAVKIAEGSGTGFSAGIDTIYGISSSHATLLENNNASAQFLLVGERGTCTMASGTTCTASFATSGGTAFVSTPVCFTGMDAVATVPATAISAKCSVSGTTVTVTAGGSNSLVWDWLVVGFPN